MFYAFNSRRHTISVHVTVENKGIFGKKVILLAIVECKINNATMEVLVDKGSQLAIMSLQTLVHADVNFKNESVFHR